MLPARQTKVMTDDELSRHRAYIAVKAKALMSRYFQPPTDDLVERDILLGWMDMLQDYTRDEIDAACRTYLIEQPSRRPHEGLVLAIIQRERRRILDARKPMTVEPERPKMTAEELEKRRKAATEIMKGFTGAK
jgi:hypothetical protein